MAATEGGQARLTLRPFLPRGLCFRLGLVPHGLHTRLRSGRCRVYRLHRDRDTTLPRVMY